MQNIVIDCFKDGKKVAELYPDELDHEELARALEYQTLQGRTWKKRIVKLQAKGRGKWKLRKF